MALNLTRKLFRSRLVDGVAQPGAEVALRVDQVLLQDVLGVLAMLEFEAMGLDRVRVPLAAQYIDHNLVEADHMNADEHLFLRSACRRFGIWYSRAGNGISHPVHMARFGVPGHVLVGSDSHTTAAGSLGMLAFGAGGADVALAMAGEPLRLRMPLVHGVRLTGALPDWVSAKDVILELLRRHGVDGGVGRVFEYHGPGLDALSAMDRHVIANMGAEMGATTSVFPSDEAVRRFLRDEDREGDWTEILADPGADYDEQEELDLSALEPLIALPSSPGNVVPVRSVAGREIAQSLCRILGQPGLPRLRRGGGDRARPPGARPRVVRHQPVVAADPTDAGPGRRAGRPGSGRGAHPTRPAATAASAWARRRRAGGSACARCRATSRAAPAHGRTASTCAARKRRRPPR